jgi:SAM-dependent methyltransferase
MVEPITSAALDPGALIYESYMVPAQFAPCAEVMLRAAKPRIGERVLDVACGTGIVARRVAVAIGETGSVIGLDSNPGMLGVARAQPSKAGASNIAYLEGNGMQLPFGDSEFDLVTCSQGLQFFSDRGRGLAEMHRVLRPGGRVALAMWTGAKRSPIIDALNEAGIRHAGVALAAAPFSLSDRNEIEALLLTAGFALRHLDEHVIECRFEDPSRMPQLAIGAAFAAVPQLSELDETTKARIRAGVLGDLGPMIAAHTRDGVLVTSQATHVAIADKPHHH